MTIASGRNFQEIWRTEVPSGVQEQNPGSESGGQRSPPEAEAVYMFTEFNYRNDQNLIILHNSPPGFYQYVSRCGGGLSP